MALNFFLCWVILHTLFVTCRFFFKTKFSINSFMNTIREPYRFRSRSGLTFCQACSWSKLFATADDKSPCLLTKSLSILIIYGNLTFVLMASTFDLNFLLFFPLQPALNSGPRVVSAVNECLVPRFDSNTKPGRSSFNIVACCRQI